MALVADHDQRDGDDGGEWIGSEAAREGAKLPDEAVEDASDRLARRSVAVGVVGALEPVEVGAVDGDQFARVNAAVVGVAHSEEREVVPACADDAVDAGVEVGVVARWSEVVGDAGV